MKTRFFNFLTKKRALFGSFYINKDNQEYTICEIQRDDSIVEATLDKFRRVLEYVKRSERVPYQPDWNHDWCNFKVTCEKDYFIKGI